jgi:hypothetical protein
MRSFLIFGSIIYFILCALVSCGQPASNKPHSRIDPLVTDISIDTSLIAVIPYDNSGDWPFTKNCQAASLTLDDMKKIERLFNMSVTDHNKKLAHHEKQMDGIDLITKKYKRQYVCVINKKGEKEVWINCLCDVHHSDWKSSILLVHDGGACYFNLKINLTRGYYYEFSVNGYA